MSIQAVAWALEQEMPARPKLVLVSIANHADHRTGYCWLKAETIADEASCSPRGVFNFIGDLIRNGYLRKAIRRGEDGKQRANDYWILFDRQPVAWNASAPEIDDDETVIEPPDETTTSGEPHAPGACGESEPQTAPRAVGPHAHTCSRIDSAEPSKTNPKADARANAFANPPRRYRSPPPEPQAADTEQPKRAIFVYVGTEAWQAWIRHRERVERRTTGYPTTTAVIDGKTRTGWWFPSLFPPATNAATGPPDDRDSAA